jgi:hypothetical protein
LFGECRSAALLGKMLRIFGPFQEALTITLDALEMKKMSLGSHFTCFTGTGTKVQILTQKALLCTSARQNVRGFDS